MRLKKFLCVIMILYVLSAICGCSQKIPNTVNSPGDLAGKNVGAVEGTAAKLRGESLGYAGMTVSVYENDETAVSALKTGLVDCLLVDAGAADSFTSAFSGIKALEESVPDGHFAFAVAKENPDLTKALNSALSAVRLDGTYDKIISGYMSETGYRYEQKETYKRSVTMGISTVGAPFCFKDENGNLAGIEPDIAMALCDRIGVRISFEEKERDDLIPSAKKGRVTFSAGGLEKPQNEAGTDNTGVSAGTDETDSIVDFTDEYFVSQQKIIVRK